MEQPAHPLVKLGPRDDEATMLPVSGMLTPELTLATTAGLRPVAPSAVLIAAAMFVC